MWLNLHETADLVTFTEEILNGRLHFFVECVIKDTWLQTFAQQKRNPIWNFSWNFSITDIFLGFCWNFELALFKEYLFMSDSNGYFSAYHVWGPSTLPIEEWKKTLKTGICLEMLRSISVSRNSQLKITWSKLRKPLMDIPWHNLTLEIILTKF